jgi:hypothetical protein
MVGVGIISQSISNKIPQDLLGVLCVIGALIDFYAFFCWRK